LIEADNKKIGKIFIVMVGMAEVAGCVSFKSSGDRVKKGELIGEFRFGGSSHCVIFNNKCELDFSPCLENAYYYD
jgi:phosphatidylserine decarboxylase